jgi:hypothetical protein
MYRKVWSASLRSWHLYDTKIHSAHRQNGPFREQDNQGSGKAVRSIKKVTAMEHLDILGHYVLRGRGNHGNVKEKRKCFMRHHVVWQIVTNISAETVACILNVEGNSYSREPRVSIVVEDLLFNDSAKKIIVLLYPEDRDTKFPRKPLYVRVYQQHKVILHKTATFKFTAVRTPNLKRIFF